MMQKGAPIHKRKQSLHDMSPEDMRDYVFDQLKKATEQLKIAEKIGNDKAIEKNKEIIENMKQLIARQGYKR